MKRIVKAVAAFGVAAFAWSVAPVQAETVTFILSGQIYQGKDDIGLFGTAGADLAGLQFTQTISTDLSNGFNNVWTDSATIYTRWGIGSTTFTGATTINGHTFNWTFSGADGDYTLNHNGPFSGDQIALDGANGYNETTGAIISAGNHVISLSTPLLSHVDPHQIVLSNGPNLEGLSNFSVSSGALGGVTYFTSRTTDNIALNPAVPEPESYALLLAGLGVAGVVARRRKATQNQLA